MPRDRSDHLQFIANFVDSATVGTFFEDLRRIKRQGEFFRTASRRRYDFDGFDDQADAA